MEDVNGNAGGNPSSQGSPSGGESGGGSGIPSGLQRFVDSKTGTVDLQRVAQSVTEAEQKITLTTQEKLAAQEAFNELTRRTGTQPQGQSPQGKQPISFEDLVKDPAAATAQVANQVVDSRAKPIVQAVLELAHPEIGSDQSGKYKNPTFVDGLNKFASTLPGNVQKALNAGDYATTNWVISVYKSLSGAPGANVPLTPQAKSNFSESANAATTPNTGGKIWTRSEIRTMYSRDPQAYKTHEAEIRKAYEEGRVKVD